MGPMTGRAAGYCAGYAVPGFMNPMPGRGMGWGRGMGRGRGMGWGRGMGRGRGMGWGRGRGMGRGRGFGRGFSPWAYGAYPPAGAYYPMPYGY